MVTATAASVLPQVAVASTTPEVVGMFFGGDGTKPICLVGRNTA
ncbi:MAG: hypothetical protein ACLQVX_08555 [Limisphaerales bacterium]